MASPILVIEKKFMHLRFAKILSESESHYAPISLKLKEEHYMCTNTVVLGSYHKQLKIH